MRAFAHAHPTVEVCENPASRAEVAHRKDGANLQVDWVDLIVLCAAMRGPERGQAMLAGCCGWRASRSIAASQAMAGVMRIMQR